MFDDKNINLALQRQTYKRASLIVSEFKESHTLTTTNPKAIVEIIENGCKIIRF